MLPAHRGGRPADLTVPRPTGGGGGAPPATGGAGRPAYVIPTTGPVTPREIYELLISKGLSTNQAVGVMANMFYESTLNPESGGTDSNGYWAGGLISWNTQGYTNARQLVTGNPQKDVRAQIDYLMTSTSGLSSGLAGASASDVAGNFAQHVEVCAECAPGAQQWTARRAQAAVISRWVASGNWPKAARGQYGAGGGAGSSGSGGKACLVKGPNLPVVGNIGCILSVGQARALLGGAMMAAALPVGLVGAIVLAAFTFRRTGAGAAVGRTAEAAGTAVAFVPGLEGAGAAVAAAGSSTARAARKQQQSKAADKAKRDDDAQARHDEAEYKKVMRRTGKASSRQAPPDAEEEPPF